MPASPDGRRIIVLEDEVILAMQMEDMLARLGYRVVGPAGRIAEALALIEAGPVDGGILDLNLGRGQDSTPVAAALAARDVPFLFATGYGEKGLPAAHAGRPVLTKPFRQAELAGALQRLFAPS